jgi:hypothetical protein
MENIKIKVEADTASYDEAMKSLKKKVTES